MEYHQPNQKYINVENADFGTKNNLSLGIISFIEEFCKPIEEKV